VNTTAAATATTDTATIAVVKLSKNQVNAAIISIFLL
jgi:hypothetical protein